MTERETFLDLLHGLLMQSSIFYLLVNFLPEAFMQRNFQSRFMWYSRFIHLINMPVPWESIT